LTEFSSADLDRVLAEARETLAAMRAGRGGPAGDGGGDAAIVRGTGTDADGQVTVTAERGRLTRVDLDPEALALTPEELGERLVAAANAALDEPRSQQRAVPEAGKPAKAGKGARKAKGPKSSPGTAKGLRNGEGNGNGTGPGDPDAGTAQDAGGQDQAEQGLRQMEQITEAINDALSKIGGGR
jgi:DNA-binding protein YbaB